MQERISSELHQLKNKEWSIKVPFQGICPFSAPDCIQHDDILTFCCNNIMKGQVFRFAFDLYPPTTEGITILAKELKLAAKLSGGVDLVSGSKTKATDFANMTSKPQLCCRLVCSCGEIYQNQSKKLNKENGSLTVNKSIQYRKATLHNDRLNDRTRKDNEMMSRRAGTCRRFLCSWIKMAFSSKLAWAILIISITPKQKSTKFPECGLLFSVRHS